MSLSPAERGELSALLADFDAQQLEGHDGVVLRRALPGEAELVGVPPGLLGVIAGYSPEGFVYKLLVGNYADIALYFADDPDGPPWTPAEVAETLGCTVADLGVLRSVD